MCLQRRNTVTGCITVGCDQHATSRKRRMRPGARLHGGGDARIQRLLAALRLGRSSPGREPT